MSFRITETRKDNGILVLNISGRITLNTYLILRDVATMVLNQGWKKIILNMKGVPFIDSSGLGELISFWSSAKRPEIKAEIKLASVQEKVDDLLTITKLYTVFEKFDSVDKAVESFNSQ